MTSIQNKKEMTYEENLSVTSNAISLFASVITLLSIIKYENLMLQRNHRLLLFAILCNVLEIACTIVISFYVPVEYVCFSRWFSTTYFSLSSILWSLAIVSEAPILVRSDTCTKYTKDYVLFCHGWPIIACMISFVTSDFDTTTARIYAWCQESASPEIIPTLASLIHGSCYLYMCYIRPPNTDVLPFDKVTTRPFIFFAAIS